MTKTNHTTKSQTVAAFLGIDLAKNSILIYGVDESGHTCIDRKVASAALKKLLGNLTSV